MTGYCYRCGFPDHGSGICPTPEPPTKWYWCAVGQNWRVQSCSHFDSGCGVAPYGPSPFGQSPVVTGSVTMTVTEDKEVDDE